MESPADWIENDRREHPENYPSFNSIDEWVRQQFDYSNLPYYRHITPRGRKGFRAFVCMCVVPNGRALLVRHRDGSVHWLLNNYKGELTMPDGTIRLTGNCPECDKHCEFRLTDHFYMEWSDNVRDTSAYFKEIEQSRRYGKTSADVEREEQEAQEEQRGDPRCIVMMTGFEASRRREVAYGVGTNELGEIVKFKPPFDVLHRIRGDIELKPRLPDHLNQPEGFGTRQQFSGIKQRPILIDPAWIVSIHDAEPEQTSFHSANTK